MGIRVIDRPQPCDRALLVEIVKYSTTAGLSNCKNPDSLRLKEIRRLRCLNYCRNLEPV